MDNGSETTVERGKRRQSGSLGLTGVAFVLASLTLGGCPTAEPGQETLVAPGQIGAPGAQGSQGAQGAFGAGGPQGSDGERGTTGQQGEPGTAGASGASGVGVNVA